MKFSLENPITRQRLGASALVLSCFIWSAGQPVQRSLQGIVLSLLHQLVTQDPTIADTVLTNIPTIQIERCNGDWSLIGLRTTIKSALEAANRPVYIFIDGLDKLGSAKGPETVLDFVDELSGIDNLKLCIPSRPSTLLSSTSREYYHYNFKT